MRRSLTGTLTLAFLLVTVTAVGLLAIFIRLDSPGRFDELLMEQSRNALKEDLVTYYDDNNSWDGLSGYLRSVYTKSEPHPSPEGDPPFSPQNRRQAFGVADQAGNVIIPLMPVFSLGQRVPPEVLAEGEPVEVDGEVVGTILSPPARFDLTPEERSYLMRTSQAILLAALGSILVALVVGLVLARRLTHPLRALTQAVQRMSGGALEQEVQVSSKDEIGQLAQAFNRMSQQVSQANRLRRQMTADIAHELRTPLTVIAGYIEAFKDGVLEVTPARMEMIYDDIEHLQRLVDDLRTLSQTDAGELPLYKQPLPPKAMLEQAAARYQHQAQQHHINLRVTVPDDLPRIYVDEGRMVQVLGNLITNALRHTPSGGEIVLSGERQADQLVLSVSDTGEGIAPEDLTFIFDRFYRADKNRHDEGSSGLGLAIVRSLVEAHGGRVEAESSPGQGTSIRICLPVYVEGGADSQQ
ncbi:MAG: ATP-binding protein [Anaerolineaceae bacterium]|jgi:signal transduction histidine kinase|nr:ATP-binding protein [Anaerolineaceae bacterium]